MKAAVGVIVTGVLVAVGGAVGWAVAASRREAARSAADFTRAYGWDVDDPSSAGVWFAAAVVGFGALTVLAGVVLAITKAR